jgi:GT2 family glycosyltransferase
MKNKPDLSVITVNYRSWQLLSGCLNQLFSTSIDGFDFEIIVVDNHSDDGGLPDFHEKFGSKVKIIENSVNAGFAAACNTGAEAARADYLLFLNPDMLAEISAIQRVLEFLKNNGEYNLVTCLQDGGINKHKKFFPRWYTLFPWCRSLLMRFYKSKFSEKTLAGETVMSTDWISGSFVMCSKVVFDQVGGWSECYWMYAEDVDLSKKITDAGGRVGVVTSVSVNHLHGGSSRKDRKTTIMTKTEVITSGHVYLSRHLQYPERFICQSLMVMNKISGKILFSILAVPLFFLPKARLRWHLLYHLINYYLGALRRKSWMSNKLTKLKFR